MPYLSAMDSQQAERARRLAIRDAVFTYRYLRVAMVALVSLLLVSVVITVLARDCPLGSISAYFYTTTHAVFVASLCAVGACLIVYHGRMIAEELLLDFSGILAFVVAFVPTKKPDDCCGGGLPTRGNPVVGVGNNVVALVLAAIAGIVLYRGLKWLRDRRPQTTEGESEAPGWLQAVLDKPARSLLWNRRLFLVLVGILCAGLAVFVVNRPLFENYAHNAAASLMFGGIVGVAGLYAGYAAGHGKTRPSIVYLILALAMAVMVIGAIVSGFFLPKYLTLSVEIALIVGFVAFWIYQTYDVWDIDKSTYGEGALNSLTGPD
jgi:hypothetical protein